MATNTLSRRTMLRGMIGGTAVSLGLPVLEAMLNNTGTALAGGEPLPRRFITFMFGNGVRLDRWTPSVQGPDYELTEELAPLANVRDYCSVLSGFESKINQADGHANGMYGTFCGYPGDYYDSEDPLLSRPTGPSIDQVAADAIGGETYLRSLQLANSKRTPPGASNTMSFRGPNQLNQPYLNPQEAYNRLFVGPDQSAQTRARVLDAVMEDAARLQSQLGQADRMRVEAHLQSIADLEAQITTIPPECMAPPMPTETNQDIGGIEPLEEVARAMADLVVVALRCDLTRVVSFQQTGYVCQSIFSMTGATYDNHSMSHEPLPESLELIHQAIVVNMQAFAYLLEGLMAEPEGAGNLLDQSVVLMGSDVAEGLSHERFDMPLIVAGGGGGRLTHPGVHHRAAGARSCSDVLLTCLQAVAPESESVGSGPGYSTSTVAELWA